MVTRQEDILHGLRAKISACRICCDPSIAKPLPHEPNPVVVLSSSARIAICGQAPGTRVHRSGIPFDDRSRDRLRQWLAIRRQQFYNAEKIAIVPMGFCFPGHDTRGSDLPPRRECQNTWHDQIMAAMPQIELLLTIGTYAQTWHLGHRKKRNLTQTVAAWRQYYDQCHCSKSQGFSRMIVPLPHHSWRNNGWLRKNDWFERELLPELRIIVADKMA